MKHMGSRFNKTSNKNLKSVYRFLIILLNTNGVYITEMLFYPSWAWVNVYTADVSISHMVNHDIQWGFL